MLRHTFVMSAVALAALLAAGCGKGQADTKQAVKAEAITVKTATSEARTVERSIMVTGSLQADETTTVTSEVAGRVIELAADFGQVVKKGQVVARLDPVELSLQLERSRATLAQAMARVGMEANQETVPDSTPMSRQAKAQMEDARTKFENAEKLVKTGDVSKERYIELEKAYRARLAGYEATMDDLRTQMASIRQLKADVKLAEKRLKDATVVAPFDGMVQTKHVSLGQYVRDNATIYTIVKAWPLRLRVDVPESAVSMVKVGTAIQFTTEAVPGSEFRAVVRELNPSLDNRSRTLAAEARMVGQDTRLKPGSFVQVKLVTNAAFPVIAVPSEAVYTVAGLNKFFTVENGKVKEHKIPQILNKNGWVEMPEGVVPAGATVAVSNVPLLADGAEVKVTGRS